MGLLMKVGELARYAEVTVRTLHHYDDLGLLTPSARSESGYRLYNEADVARLRAIQALRGFGMSLEGIARVLADESRVDGVGLIGQHIQTLEREIEQARELQAHLALFRDHLREAPAGRGSLADALARMAWYRQHFTADELRAIASNWQAMQHEWVRLHADMQEALNQGRPHDALDIQPLVERWMDFMARWMGHDFDLLARWSHMYENGKDPASPTGPSRELSRYATRAVEARIALLLLYVSTDELHQLARFGLTPFIAFNDDAQRLLAAGCEPHHPEALALLLRLDGLLRELTGGNDDLRQRLAQAEREQPLLAAGSPLSPAVHDFIARILVAHGINPHPPPA